VTDTLSEMFGLCLVIFRYYLRIVYHCWESVLKNSPVCLEDYLGIRFYIRAHLLLGRWCIEYGYERSNCRIDRRTDRLADNWAWLESV